MHRGVQALRVYHGYIPAKLGKGLASASSFAILFAEVKYGTGQGVLFEEDTHRIHRFLGEQWP